MKKNLAITTLTNELTSQQYLRYSRHLLLSEVGIDGQKKLLKSKVLIVGLGGLGSPASIYLAAAGVGCIGLVEFDTVDTSNLQRQILYTTSQVGMSKIAVAAERLRNINTDIIINEYNIPLTSSNAAQIFADYDYILDATDNLGSRYLINDACILLGKKYVFGSIYNFEGRVSVFGCTDGPCYRCIFPEVPKPENISGSLDLGVFGLLPGVIGAMQATEVVKLICNIGNPLVGRMILYDALMMTLREVEIKKNSFCSICSKNRQIWSLTGYENIRNLESRSEEINKISAIELNQVLYQNKNILLLDIRESSEIYASIDNASHIPINQLSHHVDALKKNRHKRVIVFCQAGSISLYAAKALTAAGFERVSYLEGGMLAWIKAGLPVKH